MPVSISGRMRFFEKWGIGDDIIRDSKVYGATPEDLDGIVEAAGEIYSDWIIWSDELDAAGVDMPNEWYVVAQFFKAFELAGVLRKKRASKKQDI
jgi:hypothetical protein